MITSRKIYDLNSLLAVVYFFPLTFINDSIYMSLVWTSDQRVIIFFSFPFFSDYSDEVGGRVLAPGAGELSLGCLVAGGPFLMSAPRKVKVSFPICPPPKLLCCLSAEMLLGDRPTHCVRVCVCLCVCVCVLSGWGEVLICIFQWNQGLPVIQQCFYPSVLYNIIEQNLVTTQKHKDQHISQEIWVT